MGWCDPCAADPLSNEELRQLGVFWLGESNPSRAAPGQVRPPLPIRSGRQNVFMTRLHVRYDERISRGSRLSGNRRSLELPGALCAPSRMEGQRHRARRPIGIAENCHSVTSAKRRTWLADWMGRQRHPQRDEYRQPSGCPDAGQLVATDLAGLARRHHHERA